MSRALISILTEEARRRAINMIQRVPFGTRVELKGPKRTIPQNDHMWGLLTDVARQVKWHGMKLPADDWKLIFLDGLRREMRIVPNLDGTGFVNLGCRSSDLSKSEMSDMIELIYAFGAPRGVVFTAVENMQRRAA